MSCKLFRNLLGGVRAAPGTCNHTQYKKSVKNYDDIAGLLD